MNHQYNNSQSNITFSLCPDQQKQLQSILQSTIISDIKYTDNQINHLINPKKSIKNNRPSVKNSIHSQFSAASQSDQNYYLSRDNSIGSDQNKNIASNSQDDQCIQSDDFNSQNEFIIGKNKQAHQQLDINQIFLKQFKQLQQQPDAKPISYKQRFEKQKQSKNFPYAKIYKEIQQLQKPYTIEQVQKQYPSFLISKPTYRIQSTYKQRKTAFTTSMLDNTFKIIDIASPSNNIFYMVLGTNSHTIIVHQIYSTKPYQIIQVFKPGQQVKSLKWSQSLQYLIVSNQSKQVKMFQFRQFTLPGYSQQQSMKWLNKPIQIFSLQYPKIKANIIDFHFIEQNPVKVLLVDEQYEIYIVEMKKQFLSLKPSVTKLPIKFNEFFQLKLMRLSDANKNYGTLMIVGGQQYVTLAIIQPKFEIVLVYDKQKHFPLAKKGGYPNVLFINYDNEQISPQIMIVWDKHMQIIKLKIQQFYPFTYKIQTLLKYTFPDSTLLIGNLSDTLIYQLTRLQLKIYSLNQLSKFNSNLLLTNQQNNEQLQESRNRKQRKFAQPIYSKKIDFEQFPDGQRIQQMISNSIIQLQDLRYLSNFISVQNGSLFICYEQCLYCVSIESFPSYVENTIQSINDWKVGLQLINDGILKQITQFDNMRQKVLRKQLREYSSRYIQFLKGVIGDVVLNGQIWKQQMCFVFNILIVSNECGYLLKQILMRLYRISPKLIKIYQPFILMGDISCIQVQTLDLILSVIDKNIGRRLIYNIQSKSLQKQQLSNNRSKLNNLNNLNKNTFNNFSYNNLDSNNNQLAHVINNILVRYEMYLQIIWINQYFGDYYTPFVILISKFQQYYNIKQNQFIIKLEQSYKQSLYNSYKQSLSKQYNHNHNIIKSQHKINQQINYQLNIHNNNTAQTNQSNILNNNTIQTNQSNNQLYKQYIQNNLIKFKSQKQYLVQLLSYLTYDTIKLINSSQYLKFFAHQDKFHISKIKAKYLLQTIIPIMQHKLNKILITYQPQSFFNYISQSLFQGNSLLILQQINLNQRKIHTNLKIQIIQNIQYRIVVDMKVQYLYWLFIIRLMIRKILIKKIIPGLYYLTIQHQPQQLVLTLIINLFIKQCYQTVNQQFYSYDNDKKNQLFQNLINTQYIQLLKLIGSQLNQQMQVLSCMITNKRCHNADLIQYLNTILNKSQYISKQYQLSTLSQLKQLLKKHIKLFTSIDPQKTSQFIISNFKQQLKQFISFLEENPKQQLNLLKQILNHYNYGQFLNKQKCKFLELLAITGQKDQILSQIKSHMFPLDQAIDICKKYQILDAWAFLLVKSGGTGNSTIAIEIYFRMIKQHIENYKYNRKTYQKWIQLSNSMLKELNKCIQVCIELDIKGTNHEQTQWFFIIQQLQALKQHVYKTCSPDVESSVRQIILQTLYPQLIRQLLDQVPNQILLSYLKKSLTQLQPQASEFIIQQMVKSCIYEKQILKNAQQQISQSQIFQRKILFQHALIGFITSSRCYECMRKDIETKIHYTCGHDIHPACNQDVKQCISCKNNQEQMFWKLVNLKDKVQKVIYYNPIDPNKDKSQSQIIRLSRQQKLKTFDEALQNCHIVNL